MQLDLAFSHLNSISSNTNSRLEQCGTGPPLHPGAFRKDASPGMRAQPAPCPPARQARMGPAFPPRQPFRPSPPGSDAGHAAKETRPPPSPPLNRWPRLELRSVIAFFDCGDELFSVSNEIENYAELSICSSDPGDHPSPPLIDRPGSQTTTKQGTMNHAYAQRKGCCLAARRDHQRHRVQHLHRLRPKASDMV